MDPVAFAVGSFPDEFVEMGVVHEPAEPFATGGVIWQVDIGCFAGHVLAVLHSTDGFVQGR